MGIVSDSGHNILSIAGTPFTGVVTDTTLSGNGTETSPLSVVPKSHSLNVTQDWLGDGSKAGKIIFSKNTWDFAEHNPYGSFDDAGFDNKWTNIEPGEYVVRVEFIVRNLEISDEEVFGSSKPTIVIQSRGSWNSGANKEVTDIASISNVGEGETIYTPITKIPYYSFYTESILNINRHYDELGFEVFFNSRKSGKYITVKGTGTSFLVKLYKRNYSIV